jgi:thiol-disulfide isomerase/thioredoxin
MVELPSGADRMKDMAREQYDRLGWIGKPPLAFEVPSEDGGNPLTPDTFQGDVLLIDFWAAWCKPCMAQMPHLVELYKKYNDKGFEILGVSLDSDRTRMKDAAAKVGATWPMFFDGEKWDNELVQKFDVHRIPFMILVDRKGNVRAIDPPKAALDRLIGECIKEQ